MSGKLQIDVLTLDSVQCAACGYMMESIAALPREIRISSYTRNGR